MSEGARRHPEAGAPRRGSMSLSARLSREMGMVPGTYVVKGTPKFDGLSDTGIYIDWVDARTGETRQHPIGLYAEGRGLQPGDEVDVTVESTDQFVPTETLTKYGLRRDKEYSVETDGQDAGPKRGPFIRDDAGNAVYLWDIRSASNSYLGEQQRTGDIITFGK